MQVPHIWYSASTEQIWHSQNLYVFLALETRHKEDKNTSAGDKGGRMEIEGLNNHVI